MVDRLFDNRALLGLGKINVLLAKNGAGKSFLLRTFEQQYRHQGVVSYITPERGGELAVQGGIEDNRRNPDWMPQVRRRNRDDQFRNTSVSQYQRLQTASLRRIESDLEVRKSNYTFDFVIARINSLLDNVEIFRDFESNYFGVREKDSGQTRNPGDLSSGETELISLSIEILTFIESIDPDSEEVNNWLLLDEPDVHLHPDIQYRLMDLLIDATEDKPCSVIIASHSTAILSALRRTNAHVGFMAPRSLEVRFEPIHSALCDILPIFGAHPLSNVFNENPILLVEGEDDVRIWQQAVRSSLGAIAVWPCSAGDKQSLARYEEYTDRVITSVYEQARGFSLRDRDEQPYAIDDIGRVTRARLNCRTAENLLLTDEVLMVMGAEWAAVKRGLELMLEVSPNHSQAMDIQAFQDSGWDRRNADVKNLRNIIPVTAGSTKPWEVAIGMAIARLRKAAPSNSDTGLASFLGEKIVDALRLHGL